MKLCNSCRRRLGNEDLLDGESQRMEAARLSMGLEGVSFRYYSCPRCGQDHVFLEIAPLPGETDLEYLSRKESLAQVAQQARALRTTVHVVEQRGR